MNNIGLFSGSSHFQGLGLEYELSKRYNSIEWLNKNGIKPIQTYIASDSDIHRKYRWSKLLSDKLNIREINCEDNEYIPDNDLEFLTNLLDNKIDTKYVKYIFLELTTLHRLNYEYRNYTAGELLKMLRTNSLTNELRQSINKWFHNIDNGITYELFKSNFITAQKKFPNIKFYIIDWYNTSDGNVINDFPHNTLLYPNYKSIYEGCYKNKQLIKDSSFCYNYYNKTWNIEWQDEHTNKDGQKHLSDIFYKQINKDII